MKKLRIRKRQVVSVCGMLLLAAALLLNVALAIGYFNLKADVRVLNAKAAAQQDSVKSLTADIRTVHAADGTALQRCLDAAAKKYGNAIGTKGQISTLDGKQSEMLTLEEWNAINAQLKTDRDKCNDLYN